MRRARPPDDISPHDFFTRWVPEAVRSDPDRRRRLGGTRATIVFDIAAPQDGEDGADVGDGGHGGTFTVQIEEGAVHGRVGNSNGPDLRVEVDLETWRDLNRGATSAPQALLRRRVKLHGDLLLGLKLHLILGS